MQTFSDTATGWLANKLPQYARKWSRDRATLRSEEEAIRPLRLTARNDLLHIDSFPARPSGGPPDLAPLRQHHQPDGRSRHDHLGKFRGVAGSLSGQVSHPVAFRR